MNNNPNVSIDTFAAMQFAMEAHKDHKRKYTNNPYFTHLAEVAGLMSALKKDNASIAISWLHDCMEDCGVTYVDIATRFGYVVAEGVLLLSDFEEGNRELRKKLSCERLGNAPKYIQDIKVCDLISNTSSIMIHDPKFAITYLKEKRMLLPYLRLADKRLLKIAYDLIGGENEE